MRPGQQNKRGRGRGSNNGGSSNGGGGGNNNNFNRKGGNPLTRSYDSSGPDVKIRGTAQHIAEKYTTLARDAQSSGDRVMAENYLQHAEHYNRIIASAQAQMQERFQRDERGDYNERDQNERDIDDNDNDNGGDGDEQQQFQPPQQPQNQQRQPQNPQHQPQQQRVRPQPAPVAVPVSAPVAEVIDGTGPQPVIEGFPAEISAEEEQQSAPRAPRRRAPAQRPRRQPRAKMGEGEAENSDAAPAEAPVETVSE